MKKIEAIIRPSAFDRVKEALMDLGVHGMNYTEIKRFGHQHGHVEVYRGRTIAVDFLPKVRFEVVCHDEALERILKSILEAARTGGPEGPGKAGDGKNFVSEVLEAVRIRTGERGRDAV